MKRLILFLLTVIMTAGVIAQTRKVAILEVVDRDNSLVYGVKLMLRSYLAQAVTNTPGYEAYDRTNLQQIFDEQEFQRTGYVSDDDIKRIGEMTGVQYVLVAEASKLDEKNLFITAKILNVESARVETIDNATTTKDVPSMQQGAKEMAARLLQLDGAEPRIAKSIIPEETVVNGSVVEPGHIERLSLSEYMIGSQLVGRRDYYKFMKNNRKVCLPAYRDFHVGHQLTTAGWYMLGLGLPMLATGLGCIGIGGDGLIATYVLAPVCGSIVIASIPLLAVGYKKKDNAYQKYNTYCAPKKGNAITLNLQSGRDGLGLALCF